MRKPTIHVRPVLRAGSLAYWDSMSGMIPCKVTAIEGKSGAASSDQTVAFRLTADRGAYKRGERFECWALHVVPRDAYFKRRHGARIGYYTVEV
jgi:hypothetical protein